MLRITKLVQPFHKFNEDHVYSGWKLSEKCSRYKASKRIVKLAQPIKRHVAKEMQAKLTAGRVSLKALVYKPTPRIQELATTPKWKYHRAMNKKDPYRISRPALKATPSDRIKALAQPRATNHTSKLRDPFTIQKAALFAKASHRILQLAQPKDRK